jgi:hypothetical protein
MELCHLLVPGFFYKYNPLHNGNVKINPIYILLTKLTWRNEEKATRAISRRSTWRSKLPARGIGGNAFPPMPMAEGLGLILLHARQLIYAIAWLNRSAYVGLCMP